MNALRIPLPEANPAAPPADVISFVEVVRSQMEERHQRSLAKLDRVAILLSEVLREGADLGERIVVSVASNGICERSSLSQIIREVLPSFADREFSVAELHDRLRDQFPSLQLSRATVCKKLHDLGRGQNPLVTRIRTGANGVEKKGRYRCVPPLVGSPQ